MEEKSKSYIKNLLESNVFTVSAYLTVLNSILNSCEAKVKGEVSEVKKWSSGHVYFSLKDKKDGSVLNCVIWNYDYRISGLELKDGMEIIATGLPDIYKPTGRLSFKAKTIRLVGEGELKKQYELLKQKLEAEGIFAEEKKREIPEFPETIGVITSKQGAVINDFLNNLGCFGFKIKMIDSRVEGEEATKDLLAAVKSIRKHKIDVLVVMRGGGSLESFLAFNNEILVREIADFPVPVIAAIGHDKDVPLLALAADKMVSTPTAAANILSAGWQTLNFKIKEQQNIILNFFAQALSDDKHKIRNLFSRMETYLRKALKEYGALEYKIKQVLPKILENRLAQFRQQIELTEKMINQNNPERNLKLGYCLARKGDKIVRKVSDVSIGNKLDIQVFDGTINSEIKKLTRK
ncbi:MAG: exodeoxyribonuclease VII large subunit [Candidatus Pacebacteria bacterium]|nr:exodeoxyribonuclease VII large subunit [Candidatus Paceibacterota bacterium]